jgi:hypothetical protein
MGASRWSRWIGAPSLRAAAGLIEVVACELIGQHFVRIRKALRS